MLSITVNKISQKLYFSNASFRLLKDKYSFYDLYSKYLLINGKVNTINNYATEIFEYSLIFQSLLFFLLFLSKTTSKELIYNKLQ